MKTTSLLAVALFAFAACSKSGDKDKAEDKPAGDDVAADTTTTADKPPAKAGEPPASHDALLAEYEAIREKLAGDTGAGVADHARKIATIARALPGKPEHAEIADAADKLAATDAGDLDALRKAFGDVSKPLVAMVEADPELSAKLHTFECPMAEGYKRWLQPDAELENPYMGQKMLACGSEITD